MVRVEGLDLRRGAGHLGLKRATGTFLSALGFEPKWAKNKQRPRWGHCLFGPSGGARTPDLMVPNHPRYQLRYTRLLS